MLESIKTVPGVDKAAITTVVPLRGAMFGRQFRVVGQPADDVSGPPNASFTQVTAEYHEAMGIRVTRGRSFNAYDTANSQRVAMVNEALVKRYFNGVDPIGQRILVDQFVRDVESKKPPLEWQIVGVFHNVRLGELRGTDDPEIDVPFWQSPFPYANVAVRTHGDPHDLIKSLAGAVSAVDPDVPIAGVKTMDELLVESLAVDRLGMLLFTSFAVLGLLLSAIGIYGVMAFAVSQRTQEFGVRIALGAQRSRILNLVLREGTRLALVGSLIGLAGAYLMGRALRSTLYGVEALDLRAFAAVAFVLLLAALVACLVPAMRASKVDPIEALRAD